MRLDAVCTERKAGVLMLDGPQAWKSDDNGEVYCRKSERELNTSAKMGLLASYCLEPTSALSGIVLRFMTRLAVLAGKGWRRGSAQTNCRQKFW